MDRLAADRQAGEEERSGGMPVSCEIKVIRKAALWYVLKFKVDFFSLDLVISYTL